MTTIVTAFDRFKEEGVLIGRMLTGYSDIEIALLNCVHVARDDFDGVMKAMYRSRGETQRIDVADALGRSCYAEMGYETEFGMVIGCVRTCLRIRNCYAHCIWWNDNSGKLAFANLEELANRNEVLTSLRPATARHLDVTTLQEQLAYFENTEEQLAYLNYEGRVMKGVFSRNPVAKPKHMKVPALYASDMDEAKLS